VLTRRNLGFRGSQPLGSSREEQPPRTIHRTLDFRGGQCVQREKMAPEIAQTQRGSGFKESMHTHSELDLKESQLNQRESRSFTRSFSLVLGGRQTSSKTNRQVSWVKEARKEVQR
jgi:hypothetical protein